MHEKTILLQLESLHNVKEVSVENVGIVRLRVHLGQEFN